MKNSFTLLAALVSTIPMKAQVTAMVLEPAPLAGPYESVFALQSANGWVLTPDLSYPADPVIDTLALAHDGTSDSDSLCCEAVANPSEVLGKIAVIYRGTCNYSLKALNCQQAGAVAVIIINNSGTMPTALGAGTDAELVAIPVLVITQAAGAQLREALEQGTTIVARLGDAFGYYANDVASNAADQLRPPAAAEPAILCQNSSEYSPVLGGWLRNNGSAAQDDVRLSVEVTLDGSTVYSEISDAAALDPGDSILVELAPFSQPTYGGQYIINYAAVNAAGDEYPLNNTSSTTLTIGTSFGYAPLDAETGVPVSQAAVMPSPRNGDFSYCVHFRDPNASRVAVTGMRFLATMNATTPPDPPASLSGKLFTLTANEWQDEFTGISDAAFAFDQVQEMALTDFIIDADTSFYAGFIPFNPPFVLQDDVRYLFCLLNADVDVFLGSDDVDYTVNENFDDQPTCPILNGSEWRRGLIGTTSTNTLEMIDVTTIGLQENEQGTGHAFPNPTDDLLRIPFRAFIGAADLRISDMNGAVVSSQRVQATGGYLLANTRILATGTYTFQVTTDQGERSVFKVMVSR
jgi:hypothetical protein